MNKSSGKMARSRRKRSCNGLSLLIATLGLSSSSQYVHVVDGFSTLTRRSHALSQAMKSRAFTSSSRADRPNDDFDVRSRNSLLPVFCEGRNFRLRRTSLLAAKRNRKQKDDDDMFNWYGEVDENASPEDVFWEEMERQRLLNEIGEGGSSTPGGPGATSPPSTSTTPSTSRMAAMNNGGNTGGGGAGGGGSGRLFRLHPTTTITKHSSGRRSAIGEM